MTYDAAEARAMLDRWFAEFHEFTETYWDLIGDGEEDERAHYLAERILMIDNLLLPLFSENYVTGELATNKKNWSQVVRFYRWHSSFGMHPAYREFAACWKLIHNDLAAVVSQKLRPAWREVTRG